MLEAVYEMVLPGNNISNSDLIEQVGQTRWNILWFSLNFCRQTVSF